MKVLLMAMVVLALGAIGSAQVSKDLAELADTERAFAAETVKVGFRDGFAKYFADDGIGFGPHPERTREKLLKSPPATGLRKLIFNWAPMFGDISAAGDLGYTTGPVLYTPQGPDAKPPFHGMYFSVWQKQADGSWRVVIDMGVGTPNAVASIDTKFVAANNVSRKASSGKFDPVDYRLLDQKFWSSIARTSPTKAYNSRLDDEFRIHREGFLPITDRTGIVAIARQTKFEFIDGKIASSNDLAFTYGKYETVNHVPEETGYYVHVWRRNGAGEWKLLADVQNPLAKP